jgi:hypothetical protein
MTRGAAAKEVRRPSGSLVITGACIVASVAIAIGWRSRDEYLVLPEEGLGYGLGIAGLAAMTLLLAYSLRKRLHFMRSWGAVSSWFQIHMLLGIFGPVAILYHSNFRLGSMNGNVALACTLLVAGSGVVGRILYTRIHHELSGRRSSLKEVREEVEERRRSLPHSGDASDELRRCLQDFETQALGGSGGLLGATANYLLLGTRARRAARRARRCLRRSSGSDRQGKQSLREARKAVRAHIRAVRLVGAFNVYERVFALWHVIHLPLCFLLFATAAVHVVAVHMY